MNEPLVLEVTHLCGGYRSAGPFGRKQTEIIHDVSFSVHRSEIVGLAPAKALIDCAEHYLKIEDFKCYDQVIEYHLLDMI